MSGKYAKKKEKKGKPWVWVILAAVVIAVIAAAVVLPGLRDTEKEPEQTEPTGETVRETEPSEETEGTEATVGTIPVETQDVYDLGNGLEIERIDSYAGIYMEDGSDEVVSGILMITVRNRSEQDLQLARIWLSYEEGTAEFEVTSLPAGESAVVLEKNRMEAPDEKPTASGAENVLYFEEKMDVQPERIEIGGSSGMLTVKNISGEDIEGDIYVYYKNVGGETYYGGITYRARVTGGLKAGEMSTVMANHYAPETSAVVMVQSAE